MFESPGDSARRIAREQLGIQLSDLPSPLVVSDSYWRGETKTGDPHWDLHFIFQTEWGEALPEPSDLWSELAFVDLDSTAPIEFARGHGDIVEMARRGG